MIHDQDISSINWGGSVSNVRIDSSDINRNDNRYNSRGNGMTRILTDIVCGLAFLSFLLIAFWMAGAAEGVV